MTILMADSARDLYPPSLEEELSFLTLGEPMTLVTERVIKATEHLIDRRGSTFWYRVMEARSPNLFEDDEEKVYVTTIDPHVVHMVAEYSACASKLEPTYLPDFE